MNELEFLKRLKQLEGKSINPSNLDEILREKDFKGSILDFIREEERNTSFFSYEDDNYVEIIFWYENLKGDLNDEDDISIDIIDVELNFL